MILDYEQLSKDERHLDHKPHDSQPQAGPRTRISKVFLDHIVQMLSEQHDFVDPLGKVSYSQVDQYEIDGINDRLRDSSVYKQRFARVAVVAFLLHMWRDEQYLDRLGAEEQSRARTRVLKYSNLLERILASIGKVDLGMDPARLVDSANKDHLPTYHIIAFLRGMMLANIVEHSFWSIQRLLDPGFRSIDSEEFRQAARRQRGKEEREQWYLVLVIVDGFPGKDTKFKPIEERKRRLLFRFSTEDARKTFLRERLNRVLDSDQDAFESALGGFNSEPLARVSWLTKSEDPGATEYVHLAYPSGQEQWVPVGKLVISFVGYRELCPGSRSGSCRCSPKRDHACPMSTDCSYYKMGSYPDINRLIGLQSHAKELDWVLRKVIKERLHQRSRIARMNQMGLRVIQSLLKIYYQNPRVMHDRVWARLRVYDEMQNVDPEIRSFASKSIIERDSGSLPQNVSELLCDKEGNDAVASCNRYSLIRRVIEHVSGMTDRFIANEYNRAHQCGREVEAQDETYFFS